LNDLLTDIQETNLTMINRTQDNENDLDQVDKQFKSVKKLKLEEIKIIYNSLKDIEEANLATKNREKQMLKNMNVKIVKTAKGEQYSFDEPPELNKASIIGNGYNYLFRKLSIKSEKFILNVRFRK
jgi:hypothetical protein